MNHHTLLVDGDVYLHRAVAIATTRVQFDEEEHWKVDVRRATDWIRQELQDLKAQFESERVIVAIGDRTRNFRKELCPTYKANRTAFPKPPGYLSLEARLRESATVVQLPRLEGDDVLGLMLTKEPTAGKLCVSQDKDMMGLPGWHYNPDRDTVVEVTHAQAREFHLFQTLVGDRVDGYPGCPGVGKVSATKILADGATWPAVVKAYAKAGKTEEDALLQARLAFILRQGYFSSGDIVLWTPT